MVVTLLYAFTTYTAMGSSLFDFLIPSFITFHTRSHYDWPNFQLNVIEYGHQCLFVLCSAI